MNHLGIKIGPIWRDTDVIEVNVSGRSESFAGSALIYESYDVFQRFAEALKGFPTAPHDIRTFELGSLDGKYDGGGAGFRFYCSDRKGHAIVRMKIVSRNGVTQSAEFGFPIVAAAVDDFVFELDELHKTLIGAAVLKMDQ